MESLVNIQKESDCQSSIIVGDINFNDTNWKEMKSQNPEEKVVLKTLTVLNFEQLFSDKKKTARRVTDKQPQLYPQLESKPQCKSILQY